MKFIMGQTMFDDEWNLIPYTDNECPICGKQFLKGYHNQKYCSETCREKAAHQQKKTYDQTKRNRNVTPRLETCAFCGKHFLKQSNEKYCSKECKEKAFQDTRAKYQRKRRKSMNTHELVSNENNYVGTNYLSHHRRKDFDEEQKAIQKEMKRLKLR